VCDPYQAVFAEHTGKEAQEIEAYDQGYTEAADEESNNAVGPEVGEGTARSSKTIQGRTFNWEGTLWSHEDSGMRLEVHPKANLKDTEEAIRTITSIERILQRKTVKRDKLVFKIGRTWANQVATAEGNTISLPFAQNGSSIFAVCLSRASGKTSTLKSVSLLDIVLHEIGHTLRVYFVEARTDLQMGVAKNFHKTKALMELMSPHYLGKQHENISAKFALLNVSAHLKEEPKAEKEREDFSKRIGAEIFAEMVRYFYLEPALTGKESWPLKTGFQNLDTFAADLQEEARRTCGKGKTKAEFPGPRGSLE
jgi:hypothetical protein